MQSTYKFKNLTNQSKYWLTVKWLGEVNFTDPPCGFSKNMSSR